MEHIFVAHKIKYKKLVCAYVRNSNKNMRSNQDTHAAYSYDNGTLIFLELHVSISTEYDD